jgi:hypothetical protein
VISKISKSNWWEREKLTCLHTAAREGRPRKEGMNRERRTLSRVVSNISEVLEKGEYLQFSSRLVVKRGPRKEGTK